MIKKLKENITLKKTAITVGGLMLWFGFSVAYATTTGTVPKAIDTVATWVSGIVVAVCALFILYYLGVIKVSKNYSYVMHICGGIVVALIAFKVPDILREIGVSGALF